MTNFKSISLLFFIAVCGITSTQAQDKKSGLGFYLQPEYSAMFLDDHIGNAVGFNIGVSIWQNRLDIGLRAYGRSGPINNHQVYLLELEEGQEYKGQSVIELGADHGYLGLEIAYNFFLNNDRLQIRIPFSFGQVGAGFYLKGEDRNTPDGRRVNEWEDELQNGTDAGFGFSSEIGAQVFYQPFAKLEHLMIGLGAHYINTYGYSSFLGGDDFYNNKLRASGGLRLSF